jgi:hypothetical protein
MIARFRAPKENAYYGKFLIFQLLLNVLLNEILIGSV